jgi:hypothetical protein
MQLLAPEALEALRTERPSVPRPEKVRYPFHRWAAEPFLIEFAEHRVDFWCEPKAFAAVLSKYAARHELIVQRAMFRTVRRQDRVPLPIRRPRKG